MGTIARMSAYNPFPTSAPSTTVDPSGGYRAATDATMNQILTSMQRARPWVMFMAVLGFVGAGFLMLMGVMFVVMSSAMPSITHNMGPAGPFIGLGYLVMGAFYLVPSYLLGGYANSIGRYVSSGGPAEGLLEAVQKQTSFWRFVGIFTAVMIGLYFVMIFGAIVLGVFAAASHH